MNTRTFADLPQALQDYVALHLTKQDQTACAYVCKAWRALFHPHLWRHVNVIWDYTTINTSNPQALITNAHLIQSMTLHCEPTLFRQFLHFSPPVYSRLTSADIHGRSNMGYVEFIQRGSAAGWEKLVLYLEDIISYTSAGFGGYLLRAIVRHSGNTIEVVRMEGNPYTRSHDIHLLLCSAHRLMAMCISSKTMVRGIAWRDARAIVVSNEEWVCNDLEVFGCRIGNIPCPDINRQICGGSPNGYVLIENTPHESVNLQRQVYAKLARFTKLRELRLGFSFEYGYDDPEVREEDEYLQFDCLAMTVESGLDLLRGLKEVRVLGLEDMEVYAGEERERQWFAECWPNVRIGVRH